MKDITDALEEWAFHVMPNYPNDVCSRAKIEIEALRKAYEESRQMMMQLIRNDIIAVAELQPETDTLGLWIGFKTAADRDRAMLYFELHDGLNRQARNPVEVPDAGPKVENARAFQEGITGSQTHPRQVGTPHDTLPRS